MNKGIINTTTLITLGIGTIMGTIMAVSGFFAKSWFTDTRTEVAGVKQTQAETSRIDTKQTSDIEVLKSQITNIDSRTTRTENKIDLLLQNQGLIYREKIDGTTTKK